MYPEIAQTMGNRKSVVFKVTMSVFAKSMDAKDDLRAFVWDFGQEHNQVSLLLYLGSYGSIWVHPGPSGSIWVHLGPSGSA